MTTNTFSIHYLRNTCPLKGEGGRAPSGEVMVRRAFFHYLNACIKAGGRLQKWLQKFDSKIKFDKIKKIHFNRRD